MSTEKEQLETLSEIRTLMERSSRFISLSGLSGVAAGLFALAGAWAACSHFDLGITSISYDQVAWNEDGTMNMDFYQFVFADALIVLFASLAAGVFFTLRNSKKHGMKTWDGAARRLIINLMIPLVTGGLFCLVLVLHGIIELVAPATLVFYGLGLINASKYTLNDIRYLGMCEIVLGLVSAVYIGYGLLFWAIGFGVLHIVYGTVMYFKYERKLT